MAGLLWGRGEGKPRMDWSLIQFFFSWFSFHLTTSISWADLARWRYDSDLWIELDFLSESEGDEWGRKLTIFLVCKVAPRAEPKPAVSRPGSFNSFYLNYVFSYVFRLCYFISSFRSRFALTSEGSTTTSLRQKIEKVCICLHVPPSMLPLPRKGDYTFSKKNENKKSKRKKRKNWELAPT